MQMSETTMSKMRVASRRFAASPLVAISTLWPSLRKLISSSSQMDRSSSTIKRWAISVLYLSDQRPGGARGVWHQARYLPSGRADRSRNFDDELGAKTWFGLDANVAFVSLEDLVHDGETESRAAYKSRLKRRANPACRAA